MAWATSILEKCLQWQKTVHSISTGVLTRTMGGINQTKKLTINYNDYVGALRCDS